MWSHKDFLMKINITGIILAGGKNSRMGFNKAFLEVDGKRLIDLTLSVYQQIFSEIIIVTNDSLSYLEFKDAEVVTDIYPGKGSLGGIYTGLFYANNDYAFVAACDMPSLSKDFIFFMIDKIDKHEIIVPELAEGFQALHAIYSRRCLPAIKKMILADHLKIAGLFKDIRLLKINEDQVKPFNTQSNIFININTPDDLKSYQNH